MSEESLEELFAALVKNAFRPSRPPGWDRNPTMWLSSVDIDKVMHQYETSHPHFRYLGALPRDFATRDWTGRCISQPMCTLTPSSLRTEGKTEFGVVFNMDSHTQRGSHWTGCYGCIDPARRGGRYGLSYYDSVGNPPPAEIERFMKDFQSQVRKEAARAFPIRCNTVQKQFADTECGVYALFFIVACLTTRTPFKTLCERVMADDSKMNSLRDVFFRDSGRS